MSVGLCVLLWIWFVCFVSEAMSGFYETRKIVAVYPRLYRQLRRRLSR
jgi:hypothetical protein